MKLKDGELRIYYTGGLDVDLDVELECALKQEHYEFCGSGMDIETGVRDLAFRKQEGKK